MLLGSQIMKKAVERYLKKETKLLCCPVSPSFPDNVDNTQDKPSAILVDINAEDIISIDQCSEDFETDSDYDLLSDDSSDDEELVDLDLDKTLSKALIHWKIESNASNSSLDLLLKTLKPFHPELPLSHKTLLYTCEVKPFIKEFDNGQYVYFGIQESVKHCQLIKNDFCVVKMQVNIDGLPLFTSSDAGFWPILGFDKDIMMEPVVIACFFGKGKPDIEPFLKDFVQEANQLSYISLAGKRVPFLLENFIADLPAKAFIKQSKGHTGFSSCHFCIIKGETGNGSVRFLEEGCALRNNATFHNELDQAHHIGKSPLLSLNIDMVRDFPVDYMHCSCLGVVKRIFLFLMTGKRQCRLRNYELDKISNKLVLIANDIPNEFARKPRQLTYLKRFKATEFRQILLYSSLILFEEHADVLMLFKTLLVAHFILLDSQMSTDEVLVQYAGELLKFFIVSSQKILGKDFVTLNIHQLVHMHAQVLMHSYVL